MVLWVWVFTIYQPKPCHHHVPCPSHTISSARPRQPATEASCFARRWRDITLKDSISATNNGKPLSCSIGPTCPIGSLKSEQDQYQGFMGQLKYVHNELVIHLGKDLPSYLTEISMSCPAKAIESINNSFRTCAPG